jgi:hypothetical protein
MLLGCLGEKLCRLMVAEARGHAPEVFELHIAMALGELARAREHAPGNGVQKARLRLVRGAQHFPLPPFLPFGAGLLVLVSFLAVLVDFVALMMFVLRLGAAGALTNASP